ncbi:MAG: hypothetical protein NT178_08640 [Proteobacteria bacterium]|nr:hypothetical protein [Pseudomonadota bacterium]
MLSIRKYVNRFFLVYLAMLTVSLTVLCDGSILAQENPIGVFVEKMAIDKETRKIDKCKYCGKLIKVGKIHTDAEIVVGNQTGAELDYRKIQYEWGKEKKKYLHVYIFRFEERKGSDFGVEKPAGVGFHMHIIENDSIKRIFVFDEDQRSLSENVLDIGKFFKRGAKWITVDVLSQEGIEKGLDSLADDLK